MMAMLAGSLGCPTAEVPGTKALASRPLVNVLRDTIDIAPPKELLPNHSAVLLRFDVAEFGQRAIKYIIEEPHRIENFAHGRRCLGPVGLAIGKHAVVAQISHDSRLGNPVIEQVSRIERAFGRAGNDLDKLEKSHLIDRVRQGLHDGRYFREQL